MLEHRKGLQMMLNDRGITYEYNDRGFVSTNMVTYNGRYLIIKISKSKFSFSDAHRFMDEAFVFGHPTDKVFDSKRHNRQWIKVNDEGYDCYMWALQE